MEREPTRVVLRTELQERLNEFSIEDIMAAIVDAGDRFNEIDKLLNAYCDELERRGTSVEEQLDKIHNE